MKARIIKAALVTALIAASAAAVPFAIADTVGSEPEASAAAPSLGVASGETAESSNAARAAKPDTSGWMKAAENDRLALHIDVATGELAVTDKASGTVWSSNPPDREHDESAKGAKKMDLSSQLLIDYVDNLGKPFQANSLTGSVNETAPEIKAVEGGVEMTFRFPKAEMSIPVRYTIEGDAFSAAIVTEDIKQGDKYKLVNISLLPFFGAGGLSDDGYLFVPDGSGAIIHFNNGKGGYRSYNERVYGGDAALDLPTKAEKKETVRLPVFGLHKGDHGYVAVIAKGEFQGGIVAETSGKNNGYNNVYSYLNVTEIESNLLLEGTLNEKQVTRSSASMTGNVPFEVRYYFLNGDQDSTYVGMAKRYKTYLQDEFGAGGNHQSSGQGDAGKSLPLLIDFIGGAKKRETFLGIPYNTVETLTSFKDVSEAANGLLGAGIGNLSIRMQGWSDGGAKGEIPATLNAEGKLGGTKGLRKLEEELQEQGVTLYPAVNPVHLYKGGNGFSKFADTTKSISRAPALKYEYRLSDWTKNKSASRWYLMKPSSVEEAVGKFTEDAVKKSFGAVSLEGIGSMVYSDFKKGSTSKNETGAIWRETLKAASDSIDSIMIDHPNAYAFPYAGALSDVPLYDSGFDVTDEAVPFYSIVTSGWIPSYGEPLNLSSRPRDYMLKLIETGTYPAYQFIARDSALLTGTEFDWLYSGDYGAWRDKLLGQYGGLGEAMQDILGHAIANHEKLAEGVFETTFDNGARVVVNYNDSGVAVRGMTVPAGGYLKL
ncbi:DUF5696 domain-containing protein [Paenibacillus sp. sgz302251]|uniref:DUF5696 domain-containing protein n=1 Tax=Paenibacillus sp. sgz302251 TaxID=3414493 RepID=UPI003C7BA29F